MHNVGKNALVGLLLAFGCAGLNNFSAMAAQDLKLDSDLLKSLTEELYSAENYTSVKARDIFIGMNDQTTIRDVKACFEKYGQDSYVSVGAGECSLALKGLGMGFALDSRAAINVSNSMVYGESFPWNYDDNPLYDLFVGEDTKINLWMMYESKEGEEIDQAYFNEAIEAIDRINNDGSFSNTSTTKGWSFEDGAWRFYENGSRATGWREIDGYWYYFKQDTSMAHSGFETIDGTVYHFSSDGWMDIGWHFIERNGVKCWHYFEESGTMCVNWKFLDGKWYYFQQDGIMVHSGFKTIDGKLYHFTADGWLDLGWQLLEQNGEQSWYYFDMESGNALEGWNCVGGDVDRYFFWTDGYMDQNGKSHGKGALAIGDQLSGQYIFKDGVLMHVADRDGHLLTNQEITVGGIEYVIDREGKITEKFISRLLQPSRDDKRYYSNENIFLSYKTCTWYAWGRAYEILGRKPHELSVKAAHNWYDESNCAKGNEPKLGAIACWGNSASGIGHVAVVEKIEGNKITVSEAGSSTDFHLSEMEANGKYISGWNTSETYTFRGYLYLR